MTKASIRSPTFNSLNYFFEKFRSNFSVQLLNTKFNEIIENDTSGPEELLDIYIDSISLIEQRIWSIGMDDVYLQHYQMLFHDLELLYAGMDSDPRHKFIVIIPVADRPLHLKSCLQSLLNLCQCFNYGGFKANKYSKINVIISDDSKQLDNMQAHEALADLFSGQGLDVEYFGLQQQKKIISEQVGDTKNISNIIGNIDPQAFYHKGASIMRNITYLKLNKIQQDEPVLFYFIDSDQEFQIKVQADEGDENIYAVNYFYYLDQIFSSTDVRILTGKVVGDAPVSPSVMVTNFLEDVIGFITTISRLNSDHNCQFHDHIKQKEADASYHDMADLFGYKSSVDSYPYSCDIQSEHDHVECFKGFSSKINQFFDGEHPTRKSYYQHEDVMANLESARTIYTGNYIFKPEALKYFIPFANLKLRMAGPVLGRIIKKYIADQFVSANLPMLHNRTVNSTGQSEFRPGIERQQESVDLSGEFCRQFFGDVMLFSIEKLTAKGYPEELISKQTVSQIISSTIEEMRVKYSIKHEQTLNKIEVLKSLIYNPEHWWNKNTDTQIALQNFTLFITNIETNFGEQAPGYKLVNSDNDTAAYHELILNGIMSYSDDLSSWQDTLGDNAN